MNGDKLKIGIMVKPYDNAYGRYGDGKYEALRRQGYDAVDFSIGDTDCELYTMSESELKEKLEKEKRLADAHEITISQVHGPWRWPAADFTKEDRLERLDKMKRSVLITSLLECKYLVIHPIMPFGVEERELPDAKRTWELNIEFFKELVDFAKKHGVVICLENMPMLDFSLATPEDVLAFVKTVNSDNLKICFDTGHVAVFNGLSVSDEVRKLEGYIKVLHLHDNMGDFDSHLYPEKGVIDWKALIGALDGIGFDGVLSLETNPSDKLDDEAFEKESVLLGNSFKKTVASARRK